MTQPLLGFPAVWLRHNCQCPECRDPVTGQRLVEITSIPNGCAVTAEAQTDSSVVVTFTPEGHRSEFSLAWLAAHALPGETPAWPSARQAGPGRSPWLSGRAGLTAPGEPGPTISHAPVPDAGAFDPDSWARDIRTEDGKRLWRAAGLAGSGDWPRFAWEDYQGDDAARAGCLDAVATLGFALLGGVDPEPGLVLAVAQTFGYVRETNYGRLFDVRAVADPGNLAFTGRAIAPHTDNPYRDPVPTLQLLHCLRTAEIGGDTGLVDGFAAAADFRDEDPAAFTLLTKTPWPFAYADETTELRASQPLIAVNPAGRVTGIRLNNRSMQPLRLAPGRAAAAYAAYRAWAALLARPEYRLTLRLTPGDCLIVDNTRVLHARTAFDPEAGAGGERHLQGCYADLDGLLSTLAVLRRAGPGAGVL